eukprot:762688-Hanusia_phi.AAC.4
MPELPPDTTATPAELLPAQSVREAEGRVREAEGILKDLMASARVLRDSIQGSSLQQIRL